MDLITITDPRSPVSEAYRTLRTNLQFSSLDDPVKTLVVTSAAPDEGKSTTVANLAVTLAQGGRRLLYTRFARRIGLWLSDRNLPAATLNTYLQWLVPQPKEMLGEVFPGIDYGESAACLFIVAAGDEVGEKSESNAALTEALQQGEESAGFQPHPLLANRLRYWQGVDLMVDEHTYIKNLVETSTLRRFDASEGDWGVELANSILEKDSTYGGLFDDRNSSQMVEQHANIQGEPK